jgi:hypothetical protein
VRRSMASADALMFLGIRDGVCSRFALAAAKFTCSRASAFLHS